MVCELCSFNNPKVTATAVVIRDNRLLVLKRNEEPFKGVWDLPGGYLSQGETSFQAVQREVKEELDVIIDPVLIREFTGSAAWKGHKYPILTYVYLADIGDQIVKLANENLDFRWISLKDIQPESIAFDSNQEIVRWVKETLTFDLEKVRELIGYLDKSAQVKEYSLYKAILEGKLVKIEEGGKLIGMGWLFSRQTLLRKQAVVEDMIVDPGYRGRGYGKKILFELIEWARERGVDTIELTTNSKRVEANALYKSMGFQLHDTNHYLLKLR